MIVLNLIPHYSLFSSFLLLLIETHTFDSHLFFCFCDLHIQKCFVMARIKLRIDLSPKVSIFMRTMCQLIFTRTMCHLIFTRTMCHRSETVLTRMSAFPPSTMSPHRVLHHHHHPSSEYSSSSTILIIKGSHSHNF